MNEKNQKGRRLSKADADTSKYQDLENSMENESYDDGINLDYDWNTEYGDGDIPDVDKL